MQKPEHHNGSLRKSIKNRINRMSNNLCNGYKIYQNEIILLVSLVFYPHTIIVKKYSQKTEIAYNNNYKVIQKESIVAQRYLWKIRIIYSWNSLKKVLTYYNYKKKYFNKVWFLYNQNCVKKHILLPYIYTNNKFKI